MAKQHTRLTKPLISLAATRAEQVRGLIDLQGRGMEKGLGVPVEDLTERDAGSYARWLGIWTRETTGSRAARRWRSADAREHGRRRWQK